MKILAFAASNSRKSINRVLVEYAASRLQSRFLPSAEVEFLDLNDYEMPIYSVDRENADGIHPLARAFFDKIGGADALIVSFAEYNGFVTAAWKNIHDWMSRIDMRIWQDKPVVLLAATPGPRAGANVLGTQEFTAPFFGMDIKGTHGVGKWGEGWDGERLIREEDVLRIDEALGALSIKGQKIS
ncbi:NADPH-dependent FMN reductase [Roseibium alexandrii]|uniref:NADPH-dependent FMN reductase n=1 Tax=Roseibium alexandrii TaxID=388408 RepID=UPI0037515F4F